MNNHPRGDEKRGGRVRFKASRPHGLTVTSPHPRCRANEISCVVYYVEESDVLKFSSIVEIFRSTRTVSLRT